MGQTKSVKAALPVASRGVGAGISNPILIGAMEGDASQVYVELVNKGAAGTLDVKLQDAWVDEASKYTDTGDEALGLATVGITRIPPNAVRGKYLRIAYEVKANAVEFGVHVVKAEIH